MRTVLRSFIPLGVAAALIAVTGCSSIPVLTRKNVGVSAYPPTNPATVQILREAPTRPNVKLGEISAVPQSTWIPVSETEARLREAGARMGANAVVIVVETKFNGATTGGEWWDGHLSSDIGQVFIGVPIRYTEQAVVTRAQVP